MRGIRGLGALLGVLACNGGDATSGMFSTSRPTGTSLTGMTDSSGADATGPTTAGASTDAEGTGSGGGGSPDLGPSVPAGCAGKLDFLFVLSSSWDMQIYQARLLAAMPGILAAVEASFPGFDTQFMVIDAESEWSMQNCEWCQADCNKESLPPECGAAIHPCDLEHGAGLTYPAGNGATNHRCHFAGEGRYITSAEPDVLGALKCVARVGHGGGSSLVGDAMITAVSEVMTGPDGCNAGFFRDDALLVVASVQHGYDTLSTRPVRIWSDALVAAKHGDADAILALALSADFDGGDSSVCGAKPSWDFANPQREFVASLPHGRFESICIEDYVPFFAEALAEFAAVCEGSA